LHLARPRLSKSPIVHCDRQRPWVQACSRCSGEKRPPGAFISCQAVKGKVPAARALENIGKKPSGVAPFRPRFFIFHKHGGILQSRSSFAITSLIVRNRKIIREMLSEEIPDAFCKRMRSDSLRMQYTCSNPSLPKGQKCRQCDDGGAFA
jgi:hypothetical protein